MSVPAEIATIGKTIDNDLAELKAWKAAEEAKALAKAHAFTTWFKSSTNLLHLANVAGIGITIAKLFGKL